MELNIPGETYHGLSEHSWRAACRITDGWSPGSGIFPPVVACLHCSETMGIRLRLSRFRGCGCGLGDSRVKPQSSWRCIRFLNSLPASSLIYVERVSGIQNWQLWSQQLALTSSFLKGCFISKVWVEPPRIICKIKNAVGFMIKPIKNTIHWLENRQTSTFG